MKKHFFTWLCISLTAVAFSQKLPAPDSLGNAIPDFSYCGYRACNEPIPTVDVKIVIPAVQGDATPYFRDAIRKLSLLPVNANGFRGAILLRGGDYKVDGNIRIDASGIVLRGSGVDVTRLIATGRDRRNLIDIAGYGNPITQGDSVRIADSYVPVGAMTFTVDNNNNIKVGDKILITRPSTKEWIAALGTAHFGGGLTSLGWKAGEQNISWDRTVVAVSGNKITIDAPITTALDRKFGAAFILRYQWAERIENVGVENLTIVSECDANNPKDEAHSWIAVNVSKAQDVWVRNVDFRHFASSAVFIQQTVKRVTVENCRSYAPVSELGGGRRNIFFTMGEQCLFQRLYSEYGYHDFATGFLASLNAFVQCTAYLPYSYSGGIDSWSSGILFDIVNIDGNALRLTNLGADQHGAGWNLANSVTWQCSPSRLECYAPPTAMNWTFGAWSEFHGDGYWTESNNHIEPRSLFYAQLAKRLGTKYSDRSHLLPINTSATSSPTVAQAQELAKASTAPAITLEQWIEKVRAENPINIDDKNAEQITNARPLLNQRRKFPIEIKNGILQHNGKTLTGRTHHITWWSGSDKPLYLKRTASPHLTRFVPGRDGTGLTDNIDSVVVWMKKNNIVAIEHNYGLWYDRRRDDHERIRRMTGDVWTPFYEQPFARSGQGAAYDGLSKYDLTKYNTWYWDRLKKFADLADREGLVLLHNNYFQHNIIEAGAHWADSPWRSANNINNTDFPEPPPYAGDKRIFQAELFYDINHPVRRELHRNYIRQCLNNFKDNTSVVQLISAEYTGPLHFVEFWLDVISEWQKETGIDPLIALSTTKDVQDAILADPVRSKVVDIIDIQYWFYRSDGSAYAPEGGQNLAPRQHARVNKPGQPSYQSVLRAVKEYRDKYPDKAVIYSADG
ncbi:MAG: DUF6298 domain-containing protein, partial [Paludibacter sp.]|nr:DUF6298 domain-containing protein [Paludibacter sp.]